MALWSQSLVEDSRRREGQLCLHHSGQGCGVLLPRVALRAAGLCVCPQGPSLGWFSKGRFKGEESLLPVLNNMKIKKKMIEGVYALVLQLCDAHLLLVSLVTCIRH